MSVEKTSIIEETDPADAVEQPVAEEASEASAGTEDDEATERTDEGTRPGRVRRLAAGARVLSSRRILAAVLALLVAGSLGLLGWQLYYTYLPDRETDAAAAKSAVAAASEGAVAILSYTPETLDQDFATAKSRLTGDFLSYYENFTQQIVAPAAKQKSIRTTAVVLRAALKEFHPDSAEVLLFVNQTTQSASLQQPTLASSSVEVKLTRANGKWLISAFTPL
jgi:Mce-associated membrane protein